MQFRASPVTEEDARSDFQSPLDTDLSDFLRDGAMLYEGLLARTFVVRRPEGDRHPQVPTYGFYSISMRQIDVLSDFLDENRPQLPVGTDPRVGVVLLGMFARDYRVSGLGVAEFMMADIVERVVTVASHVGCYGAILETKHEALVEYYKTYGFASLKRRGKGGTGKFRMFYPIQDARAVVAERVLAPLSR
jgi:hypothetical protein